MPPAPTTVRRLAASTTGIVRRYPKLSTAGAAMLLATGIWVYNTAGGGRKCGPCPCGKEMVVIPSAVTVTAGQQVQFTIGCK